MGGISPKTLAALGVLGLGATTIARGIPTAAEQFRRTEALRLYRREDPSTPMPSLTVHASYEKFASEKRADNPVDLGDLKNLIEYSEKAQAMIPKGMDIRTLKTFQGLRPGAPPPTITPPSFGTRLQEGVAKGIGQGMSLPLGDFLIRAPLTSLSDLIKKQLFTIPSQRKAFQSATEDENLSQFRKENPGMFESAHRSLTTFAPEASTDPNVVKNYLNQIMMTRGNVDIATLKLLAETEKALQQTRETSRR